MAKQVSEEVRKALRQIRALEDRVLDGNLDPVAIRKPLQALIGSRHTALGKFVALAVDGKTIAELLEMGKFESVSGELTDQHFPVLRTAEEVIEVTLFRIGESMITSTVLQMIEDAGLAPLNQAELLAWAVADKSLGLSEPVVQIGQMWLDAGTGDDMCGYLRPGKNGRRAHIDWDWPEGSWPTQYQFACRRK